MTSAKDAETDAAPEKDKPKMKGKKEKSEKSKSAATKATGQDKDTKEKVVKKRVAKAKEIDKTQSKRLVKPKRTVVKKVRKSREPKPPQEIKPRNIGVEVTLPTNTCSDQFCPFHGKLSVRGQIISGVVVSSKMNKTAVVQREIRRFIPKYERYEKRTHKYSVHNPECINGQRGDMVKIMECRPISKSKSFVIIERLEG
jgi:small subunit ribosomal protein S17